MSDGENSSNAKRRRPNEENDPTEIASATVVGEAVDPNEAEQSSDIFKLDIDCLHEAMDYLSIKYLTAVAKTCKRMSRMAGFIFNQNYPGAWIDCRSDESKYFPQFIKSVEIDSSEDFQYFAGFQSKFRRIKQLKLYCESDITISNVQSIKDALSKVNLLSLEGFTIDSSTLETLIRSCPNIQHLHVDTIVNGNEWLLRKYPMLERFETIYNLEKENIVEFLELNPNIRSFATRASFLLTNEQLLKSKNITLNDFMVDICDSDYPNERIFILLNELYDKSFYKRLHLRYYEHFDQEEVEKWESLKGLVKINLKDGFPDNVSLSELSTLEELTIWRSYYIDDWDLLPHRLVNLKRIRLGDASFENLMVLISSATRLDKIRVDQFYPNGLNEQSGGDMDDFDKIVDISAMNKARQELADGRELKVTIYIDEKAYLATKWAFKGTERGLIQLKRLESYTWDNEFVYYL